MLEAMNLPKKWRQAPSQAEEMGAKLRESAGDPSGMLLISRSELITQDTHVMKMVQMTEWK